jgi:uncharacterized protein (DUF4415 family)
MSKRKNYSEDDLREVSENPEWTEKDVANAKPFADVFPELAVRLGRGLQKAPTKVAVSLRLDRDIIEALKSGGEGWQSRANMLLRKAVGLKEKHRD